VQITICLSYKFIIWSNIFSTLCHSTTTLRNIAEWILFVSVHMH
jgi:hypothetical protein